MRRQKFKRIYGALGVARTLSAAFAGILATLTKANPGEIAFHLGENVAQVVASLQSWAWAYTPMLLLLAWLLGQYRERLGDPAVWDELHTVITSYRNRLFADTGSGAQFHRRVTLFKHVRFALVARKWPWDEWLIPVVRSGHTTQLCKSRFRISKKSRDVEGVAGKAWIEDGAIDIQNLPDMQSPTRSEEQILDYAKQTGMPVDSVRKGSPQGRSFYALRVQVKGKEWGVLVVDSRLPTLNAARARKLYKETFAISLGLLLQRI